jgi:hypothetical protein
MSSEGLSSHYTEKPFLTIKIKKEYFSNKQGSFAQTTPIGTASRLLRTDFS